MAWHTETYLPLSTLRATCSREHPLRECFCPHSPLPSQSSLGTRGQRLASCVLPSLPSPLSHGRSTLWTASPATTRRIRPSPCLPVSPNLTPAPGSRNRSRSKQRRRKLITLEVQQLTATVGYVHPHLSSRGKPSETPLETHSALSSPPARAALCTGPPGRLGVRAGGLPQYVHLGSYRRFSQGFGSHS